MSTLLYDANGQPAVGRNGDKYPDLPLGTYFANAGLSRAEAERATAECMGRAKQILRTHLRELEIREPGAARRYLSDWTKRDELNRKVLAAALIAMGFDSKELREIDRGMKLQLLSPEPFVQRARTMGPTGPVDFEITPLDPKRENGKTHKLTNLKTGEVSVH